jgi:hypothetical protein
MTSMLLTCGLSRFGISRRCKRISPAPEPFEDCRPERDLKTPAIQDPQTL